MSDIQSELTPETTALIAAAVAMAIQKPHKIVSIQESQLELDVPLYILNPWSMEGRFQHFSSHKIR